MLNVLAGLTSAHVHPADSEIERQLWQAVGATPSVTGVCFKSGISTIYLCQRSEGAAQWRRHCHSTEYPALFSRSVFSKL